MNPLEEATLCGIMIGDGCITVKKYKRNYTMIVTLGKDDGKFIDYTGSLLKKMCPGKVLRLKDREKDNAVEFIINSKDAFEHIVNVWNFPIGKKHELEIPPAFLRSWRLTKRVISGLVATDGTIFFAKQHREVPYYPRVEICSSSDLLLDQITGILRTRGYKVSRWSKRLGINGVSGVERFSKDIGFINPKHITRFRNGPVA